MNVSAASADSVIEERARLVERNTAELLAPDELRALLAHVPHPRHYIGFEISGQIHLGTGLVCMGKIKDFMDAGFETRVFLADWHTWINDKLGGNRDVIRHIATDYFAEGLKASLVACGGDPRQLSVVFGSDLYEQDDAYWETVIEVSKHTTLARMQRSISILGRKEGDSVDFAKLIYPAMQAADIFSQQVHLAHAGMDQRKAHVIARDVADKLTIHPLLGPDGTPMKPIAIHHPLLLGLKKPPVWPIPPEEAKSVQTAMKMSKSDFASAVFVDDDPDTIRKKVGKAFCPPLEASFNPVLDWWKRIVFARDPLDVVIARTEANGGNLPVASYDELEDLYVTERLHPMDLKEGLAARLIDLLEPARTMLSANDRYLETKRELSTLIGV